MKKSRTADTYALYGYDDSEEGAPEGTLVSIDLGIGQFKRKPGKKARAKSFEQACTFLSVTPGGVLPVQYDSTCLKVPRMGGSGRIPAWYEK